MADILKFTLHGQEHEVKAERSAPWAYRDPVREKKFAKWFEGDNDLKNDKYLDAIGASRSERNQRRWLTEHLMEMTVNEAFKSMNAQPMSEQVNVASNFATFTTAALPLIRQLWPRQFLREVMGLQGMKQPTSRAFFKDDQFRSSGGAYASGTSIYTSPDPTYSDDLGEGATPRYLRTVITGETITADSKKLISDWSIEAQQNAMAYHQFALEPEQMKMLGLQIVRERNREAINTLVSNATTNTNWAADQPSSGGWANATPKEYQEELADAITDANQEIFTRVFRDATVILCGPGFAGRIEKLSRFREIKMGDAHEFNYAEGPNLIGTLATRYRVYKDVDFADDQALLAFKSGDWLDVGAVHMEFVPLWVSPLIPATTFTFSKGVMNRSADYVKKTVGGQYYAMVTVA